MAAKSQKGQAGGERKGVESLAQQLKRGSLTTVLSCHYTLIHTAMEQANAFCHCPAQRCSDQTSQSAAQAQILAQLSQLTHTDWQSAPRLEALQHSRWRTTAHWR